MQRTSMLAVALLVALPGVGGHALDLEGELTEILALLPGRYRGVAPDPRDPEAPAQPLFHKIVRIDAPQFGSDAVYYHVIAREGYDSVTPFQQKIYAFDRSAGRAGNAMRSWVFECAKSRVRLVFSHPLDAGQGACVNPCSANKPIGALGSAELL